MTLKLKPQGELKMGLTRIAVKLRNLASESTLTRQFLVDTGTTDSMVSASELKRIGVVPSGKRAYELATGELIEFEIGYAELSFMGDTIQTRVIFGPDNTEPILGVVALELAGLVVDPTKKRLRKLPALPLK